MTICFISSWRFSPCFFQHIVISKIVSTHITFPSRSNKIINALQRRRNLNIRCKFSWQPTWFGHRNEDKLSIRINPCSFFPRAYFFHKMNVYRLFHYTYWLTKNTKITTWIKIKKVHLQLVRSYKYKARRWAIFPTATWKIVCKIASPLSITSSLDAIIGPGTNYLIR